MDLPSFELFGISALNPWPFPHFLIVRHSVKSRDEWGERESDLGRRGEPRVIVDGPPPWALDGGCLVRTRDYRVKPRFFLQMKLTNVL